ALADQAPFELSEDAAHLTDGGTHRIVRVVFEDLAAVAQAEHMATGPPDLGQDALLLGHLPSQAVERREHGASYAAVLGGVERLVQTLPSVYAIRPANALV